VTFLPNCVSRKRLYLYFHQISISRSRYRAPLWDLQPDIISCRNVALLSRDLNICLFRLCLAAVGNLKAFSSCMELLTEWPSFRIVLAANDYICTSRFRLVEVDIEHRCGTSDHILFPVGMLLCCRVTSISTSSVCVLQLLVLLTVVPTACISRRVGHFHAAKFCYYYWFWAWRLRISTLIMSLLFCDNGTSISQSAVPSCRHFARIH
jgi:hypothetical protein